MLHNLYIVTPGGHKEHYITPSKKYNKDCFYNKDCNLKKIYFFQALDIYPTHRCSFCEPVFYQFHNVADLPPATETLQRLTVRHHSRARF